MTQSPPLSKKAQTRAENMRKIISAAEKVFAKKGFSGGTTQEIATEAGLPKANVHYYFPTKEQLYTRLLDDILEEWIDDAAIFDTSEEPEVVFRAYITRKIEHSFSRPYASKVWAMEIIGRGKVFEKQLKHSFLTWNERKVSQIRTWIEQGKLRPVDPQNLMYAIWAVTQHYADFEHQIRVVNGGRPLDRTQANAAIESVLELFLKGVLPRDPTDD